MKAKRKKIEPPTLDNLLRLFSRRLDEFSGESKRSYQKAFSSFQVYLISNYSLEDTFDKNVIANWLIYLIISGLSPKTVVFYLEKIAGLYSGVAKYLEGGKQSWFKEIKKELKDFDDFNFSPEFIKRISSRLKLLYQFTRISRADSALIDAVTDMPVNPGPEVKNSIRSFWGALALHIGIRADMVLGFFGSAPPNLGILSLAAPKELDPEERHSMVRRVALSFRGEQPSWFAMRLRPKVKYETLIQRFATLSGEVPMPELFYPCEEITKKIRRKLVWEGKPVIRDIVFFKIRKSEIYPLFTRIYDLAWCYRNPGGQPGNYASIPPKAMDSFREAIGFLTPDFEVAPSGEMALLPGDKVVILDGDYAMKKATVLKAAEEDDGTKIFRVSLLHNNGHWDIGIDARLLKKA